MRQNTTDENETPEGISVQKHDVIRLLIEGETVSAAASAVGVHRSTVHRWLSTDAAFCAELNRLKDDLVHANHQRLLLLVERAIGVFETGLSESDGKLALSFLRSMGFVLPHRSAQLSSDDVRDEWATERAAWRHGLLLRQMPSKDQLI